MRCAALQNPGTWQLCMAGRVLWGSDAYVAVRVIGLDGEGGEPRPRPAGKLRGVTRTCLPRGADVPHVPSSTSGEGARAKDRKNAPRGFRARLVRHRRSDPPPGDSQELS